MILESGRSSGARIGTVYTSSVRDFEAQVINATHRQNLTPTTSLTISDRTGIGPDHSRYSNGLEICRLKLHWARVL